MDFDATSPNSLDHSISHLANLTSQRDRDLLDVTLAQGVLELLPALSVGVYRLVGQDEQVQRWLCCGLARKGELTVSDPSWIDFESLPLGSDFPMRMAVVESRMLSQADITLADEADAPVRHVTILPLMVELGLPGVLEVISDRPLPRGWISPMQTLLRVFANFQNLLESSQRDSLTGLLNRQTFDATFLKASMPPPVEYADVGAFERRSTPVTGYWLGVIDIDLFKLVNDRFGHLIGDEVLVLVARIMRQSFRHYDRLYRFGGEEFVVLLRGGTEPEAWEAFDRFRINVENYKFPQVEKVTISLGFTEVMHNDTPSAAFSRADQGVYQAKHQGRNQVLCFEALVRDGVLKTETSHVVGDVELF